MLLPTTHLVHRQRSELVMAEPKHQLDWHGALLDVVIIASLTVLCALRIASLTIFLAVTGPIVGARLAAARAFRGGNGGGALAILIGLFLLLRRPFA
jgi:hypothetical protein